MSKTLTAVLAVFSALISLGQNGDFPITHHQANIKGLEYTTNKLTFDQLGLMYAATTSGVLRYDGVYWDFIETPSATFSISVDDKDQIYVGSIGSFGKLELTGEGLKYVQINKDSLGTSQFWDIQYDQEEILFVSDEAVCIYNSKSGEVTLQKSPDRWPIEALIQHNGKRYLTTRVAVYEWSDKGYKETQLFQEDLLPIKVQSRNNLTLVLNADGRVFLFSEGSIKPYDLPMRKVQNFHWVTDSSYVVSCRNNGALLVGSKNGKVLGTINYKTGLPDDEIEAIQVDWNHGIWIAHQFGFSRVDPSSPISCLSNQEGLEGNLITSADYRGKVLIGTSSGLFWSVPDTIYEMEETALRLDKKNQQSDEELSIKEIKWVYKRIPGITNKVNVLQEHAGKLLVGTNEGLFEYNGRRLEKITGDPVSEIQSLPRTREFLTVDNFQVSRFLFQDGVYTEMPFGIDDQPVVSVFGDRKSMVWLVGTESLRGAGLTYQGASVIAETSFPNRFMEVPTICELDNGLYFITSQGYFKYHYQKQQLEEDQGMLKEVGKPVQHLKDPDGGFWSYDGKLWKHVDKKGAATTYPYLSLFPDLRFIHRDGAGNIYFINSDNKFYYYQPKESDTSNYTSNVFYKHLFAKSSYSPYLSQVHLDYDQNYLKAEVTQPDYLGLLKVEYQYQLVGLDENWSEWSEDNRINLNFLPEGKYTLQVRSRDVFGRLKTIDPISLVVAPPYWQTTWFYFLEVLFFATLVLISTRLNQGKATNRFLTEGLTVLTIVIIIETLQSAAGSYVHFATSPFIDFIINLCIALVIFPLELLLKKIIKSGKVPVKLKGHKSAKA